MTSWCGRIAGPEQVITVVRLWGNRKSPRQLQMHIIKSKRGQISTLILLCNIHPGELYSAAIAQAIANCSMPRYQSFPYAKLFENTLDEKPPLAIREDSKEDGGPACTTEKEVGVYTATGIIRSTLYYTRPTVSALRQVICSSFQLPSSTRCQH